MFQLNLFKTKKFYNNVELFIFNLHLKSKVNAKKKDENFIPFRFAELRAIRKNVKKLTSSDSLIVYAGDFNDEPTKPLLRNLGDVALVQQSDKTDSSFTYYWHKKDILYKYDYFLVSRNLLPLLSTAVVCEHQNGSDHKPVYVDIKLWLSFRFFAYKRIGLCYKYHCCNQQQNLQSTVEDSE